MIYLKAVGEHIYIDGKQANTTSDITLNIVERFGHSYVGQIVLNAGNTISTIEFFAHGPIWFGAGTAIRIIGREA